MHLNLVSMDALEPLVAAGGILLGPLTGPHGVLPGLSRPLLRPGRVSLGSLNEAGGCVQAHRASWALDSGVAMLTPCPRYAGTATTSLSRAIFIRSKPRGAAENPHRCAAFGG